MKLQYIDFKLIILFLCAAFLFSCSDNNDRVEPEKYFIRLIIDGNIIKFDNQGSIGAIMTQTGPQHSLNIYGSEEDISGITIQVMSDNPISTGLYSGFSEHATFSVGVLYTFVDEFDNFATDGENPVGSVNITELSEVFIRGFFTAELKNMSSGEQLTISSGEFYLLRMD